MADRRARRVAAVGYGDSLAAGPAGILRAVHGGARRGATGRTARARRSGRPTHRGTAAARSDGKG
jgi:hypothetical protein